jgi:uracil-DNA glycosylase
VIDFPFALIAVAPKVNTAYMVPSNSPNAAGNAAHLSNAALADAMAAAMAWWRDAGVDCDLVDEPQDWLATARPRAAAPPPGKAKAEVPVVTAIAGGRTAWPDTLEAFAQWWMTEPALTAAGATRVPPAGPREPDLMVIAAMPEADDGTTLLSGPAGRLLDGFLAAAGLARAEIYCAAALPSRITAPDWAALAEQGLGDLLAHHVALVRPRRAILFGQSGISTLLRHDSPNNSPNLHSFNHTDDTVPILYALDLEAIVARPALKAGLWNRWLDWKKE